MKYFQLDGTIDEILLTKFMDFCNANSQEDWTIVINSGGGKCTLASVILNIINNNAEKTTLISAGVYSAAFYIFYFAKCKRKIVYGSLGMHHKEYLNNIYINDKGKPKYDQDKCEVQNMKSLKNNFLKHLMTKEELKKYEKDESVFFTFSRMKKLFPKLEIIS